MEPCIPASYLLYTLKPKSLTLHHIFCKSTLEIWILIDTQSTTFIFKCIQKEKTIAKTSPHHFAKLKHPTNDSPNKIKKSVLSKWHIEWETSHWNSKLYLIKPNINKWLADCKKKKYEKKLCKRELTFDTGCLSHLLERKPPPIYETPFHQQYSLYSCNALTLFHIPLQFFVFLNINI